ncbi:MAG: hotdog fold thioesterase [Deltaproteobacteria bacterium]|nr:hotdog fold thioesterase [Deltaproteobacteria bacterium]
MEAKKAVELLWARTKEENFPKLLNLEVLDIEPGRALVAMNYTENLTNIFGMLHGGAVFSLLDEAFQLACNAHGEVAVALQLSIHYLAPAEPGARLLAEVREINATRKTALYEAEVRQDDGKRIASGQALAYRKGKPLPFTPEGRLAE